MHTRSYVILLRRMLRCSIIAFANERKLKVGKQVVQHPGLAEFRHQQQNSGQPLLAGVEEPVDKIRLRSHTAGQQKLQKQIGYAVHQAPDCVRETQPDEHFFARIGSL
jgi:hypothetical protein